jgi:hypothetical protein
MSKTGHRVGFRQSHISQIHGLSILWCLKSFFPFLTVIIVAILVSGIAGYFVGDSVTVTETATLQGTDQTVIQLSLVTKTATKILTSTANVMSEPQFVNISGTVESENYYPVQVLFEIENDCPVTTSINVAGHTHCLFSTQFSNLTASDGQGFGNGIVYYSWAYSAQVLNNQTYAVIIAYSNGTFNSAEGVADIPVNTLSQKISSFDIKCFDQTANDFPCSTFSQLQP